MQQPIVVPTPSRIARANMSSVQVPAPVSRSGVMFGATTRLPGSSRITCPAPFMPALGGAPGALQSRSEWHTKHCRMPSAR
jgi:hypothetical protein